MADSPHLRRPDVASADALDAAVRLARLRQVMFARVESTRIAQYHVLRQIGGGGMGLVFAAWDPSLDRVIAIKVLRDPSSPRAGTQLRDEAVALARLRHPNVVSVFEVGEHEGRTYLAMEYVAGQTLRAFVRAWQARGRDLVALLDVFVQAANGLVAAHAAGLVHGDVKPENVMLDAEGRARLMDFGLARHEMVDETTGDGIERPTAARELVTHETRGLIGTPAYMASEQFRGVAPSSAADQFALCACLFEALYGRRARPERMDDAAAAAETPVEVPAERGVPRRLQALVRRGLAIDPAARWPSMRALCDELLRVRRAGRAKWIAVGSVGIAAAGLTAGLLLADGEPRCTADLGTWGEGERTAVAAAFATLGGPTAAGDAARVHAQLDDYANAWVDTYRQACTATFVDREQSEQLFDKRMRCLERRRNRLSGAIDALLTAEDAPALAERTAAAFKLPAIAACSDLDALAETTPWPDDPVLQARLAELRERIDRSETSLDVGDFAGGLVLAADAVTSARVLEHPPLLAEALVMLGRLQISGAAPDVALETLREAILVAAQVGDHHSEAVAWTELLVIEGLRGEIERGLAQELAAQSAVERAGDEVVRSWLLNALGVLYGEKGDSLRSLDYLERALETKESVLGPGHLDVGIAWYNLGNVYTHLVAFADADQAFAEARSIFAATVGQSHPLYHYTTAGQCLLELDRGNPELAVELCTAALTGIVAAHASPHWTSRVGFSLARAQWATGLQAQARASATEARRNAADADPATHDEIDRWLADPDAP